MPTIKQHIFCLVVIVFKTLTRPYTSKEDRTYTVITNTYFVEHVLRRHCQDKQICAVAHGAMVVEGDECNAVVFGACLLQANAPRACFTDNFFSINAVVATQHSAVERAQ